MIENVRYIRNFAVYNDSIYFVAGNYDELFAIRVNNPEQPEVVSTIPWKRKHGAVEIFLYNNSLVMAASNDQIAIYHLDERKMEFYSADTTEQHELLIACIKDDRLLLYPRDARGTLMEFQLGKKQFCRNTSWDPFQDRRQEVSRFMYGVRAKNKILLSCMGSNLLYMHDPDTGVCEPVDIPVQEGIAALNCLKEKLYFTSAYRKKVYITDLDFDHVRELTFSLEEGHFARPQPAGDNILLFDEKGLILLKGDHFERVQLTTDVKAENTWFFSSVSLGKQLLYLPWTADKALIYDQEMQKFVQGCPLRYPRKELLRQNQVIREGKVNLVDFLEAIR